MIAKASKETNEINNALTIFIKNIRGSSTAISNYNKATSGEQSELIDGMKLSNKALSDYISQTKSPSLTGYIKYLATSSNSTAILTAKTVALNMAMSYCIGLIVQLVATEMSKWINRNEELKNSVAELTDEYESSTKSIKDNLKTLEGLGAEFSKLSKGVDDNGKNVKLSAEEYDRYREIVQQVVDISPSLVLGYNAEGEAIVDNNSLIKEAIVLQKELNKQKTQEYLTGGADILEDVREDVKRAKKEINVLFSDGDIPLDLFSDKQDYSFYKDLNIDTQGLFSRDIDEIKKLISLRDQLISKLSIEYGISEEQQELIKKQIDLIDLQVGKIDAANQRMQSFLSIWASSDQNGSWYNNIKTGFLDEFNIKLNEVAANSPTMTIEELQVATRNLGKDFAGIQSSIPSDEVEELKEKFEKGVISSNQFDEGISNVVTRVKELASRFKETNPMLHDLLLLIADGYNKISSEGFGDINTGSLVASAEETKEALEKIAEAFSDLEKTANSLNDLKDEIKETGKISGSTISSLMSSYPQLVGVLNKYLSKKASEKDIVNSLSGIYDEDSKAYKDLLLDKYEYDSEFFDDVFKNNQEFFKEIAKEYKANQLDWKSMADVKRDIDSALIKDLRGAWSEYFRVIKNANTGLYEVLPQKVDLPKIGPLGIIDPLGIHNLTDDLEAAKIAAEEAADKANAFDKALEELANGYSKIPDSTDFKKLSSSANSANSTIFDWINTKIEVTEKNIDILKSKIESVSDFSLKSQYTNQTIKALNDELNLLDRAHKKYIDLANSVGLSSEYVSKIQKGALSIDSISDSKLKERIDTYKKWYDSAESVKGSIKNINKEIKDLVESLKDIELSKFEAIADLFDSQTDIISDNVDKIKAQIELYESQGILVSEKLYSEMISKTQNQLDFLYTKRSKLIESLNKSVSTINDFTNTDQWERMVSAINDVDSEISNAESSLIDFNKAINEIKWDIFDNIFNRLSGVNSELENLIGILENYDMTDLDGNLTDEGIARIGLLAQQYELATYEVEQYSEQIDELTKAYNNGEYSTVEYFEKLQELNEAQWDSVNATESIKDAIIDTAKARVDSEIESIEEAISAYEKLIKAQLEELRAEKELNDFRDSISDKQKDITKIEKQLLAISTDTSQEATAKRAKLQAELSEARDEMDKLYKDQSYKDREDALNKELERFRELQENKIVDLNEYLEDENQLISDYIDMAQNNAYTIADVLEDLVERYGIKISDSIISPWKKGENAISDYRSKLSSSTSSFTKNLRSIKDDVLSLSATSDILAQSFISMFNVSTSNFTSSLLSIEDILKRINNLTGESTSSTGRWFQDANNKKWWYVNPDGSYTKSGWQNIDGKDYYFDKEGWMLSDTVTPDGYRVDSTGAWDGNKSNSSSSNSSSTSKSGSVSDISGYVKYGDTGESVKKLQTALSELGYSIGKTGVDGKFGANTLSALKKFQLESGISSDGVVGSQTKNVFRAKGYSVGGVVSVVKPAGEDTIIAANNRERVLTQSQNKAFEKLVYEDTPKFVRLMDSFDKSLRGVGIGKIDSIGNTLLSASLNDRISGGFNIENNININGSVTDNNVDRIISQVNSNIEKAIDNKFKYAGFTQNLKRR